MTRRTDTPPDMVRPDVGAIIIFTWRGPEGRVGDLAEVISTIWTSHPWPDPASLSHSLFVGEDGRTVLHYVQSTTIDVRPDPPWKREVDEVLPGVERIDVTAARPYRSTAHRPNAPRPGCYVLSEVMLTDSSQEGQQRWVDAVFDSVGEMPPPGLGLIAAHYYKTMDSTRVLKFAEWTTAEAHERAPEEPRPELREETSQHPGVERVAVGRYRFAFGTVPDPEELVTRK